jgi:DNA-binding transcriptional LysR family regulator
MTLTELKYIVAVAREKHFGKAAEACFVSQPTLSVAVKKLEDELELKLFERSAGEVTVTPLGDEIVRQAQSVLEQAAEIKEIAKRGKDPLGGPLKLGVIYTIGPYLLPDLVRQNIALTPQMPLMLQENFTVRLLEMLRTGEIDCAILAEPFPDTGLAIAPLYDEPFMAALPAGHPLAAGDSVSSDQLKRETHAAAGHRPLLSRPRAAGVPRVRALFQQHRGHSQELRGLVAGDHQAHGGRRHGRDAGAAPGGAARGAGQPRPSPTRRAWCATCRSTTTAARRPRAAWCWPGAAASRATRRLPRCATPSTPASCRRPSLYRIRLRG